MKTLLALLGLLFVTTVGYGQYFQRLTSGRGSIRSIDLQERSENAVPNFALSLNPAGFLMFGPVVNAEFGLTDNLVLNTHVRMAKFGLLSYVIRGEETFKIDGFGVGGGVLYFFTSNRHKPYVGLLGEFEKAQAWYDEDEPYEKYEDEVNIVVCANGGYRFRISDHFFINTGGYLGVTLSSWEEVYTDAGYTPESGTEVVPFYMLDISLGLAF